MLRAAWNWLTGIRIAWIVACLIPLDIAGTLLIAGYEPDKCAGYRGPHYVTCALLHTFVAELRWIGNHDKFFVAAGTIALAAFTFTLWRATNGLLKAATRQDDVTRILQRAYLSVEPAGVNPFISSTGEELIVGHIEVRNVGRLPARNVSIDRPELNWIESGDVGEDRLVPTESAPMTIVLAAGATMRVGTGPQAEVNRMSGDGFFYVWGIVRYTDGFGTPRFTKFCHRYPARTAEYIKEGDSSRRIKPSDARYHHHGNDAD